jgi:hypothetical protein
LRYFTFCAVGAIDVLMLDVARVLGKRLSERFDTVVFFDKTPELVEATQRRIPGSIGFPGQFTNVVVSGQGHEDVPMIDPLEAPAEEENETVVWERQNLESQRVQLVRRFPFDVINLDLEQFAFRPKDPLPGNVIRAMQQIVEWQKRPLPPEGTRKKAEYLESFILMFTTQVGPPDITDDYRDMLRHYLDSNVRERAELLGVMNERLGYSGIDELEGGNFAEFFKLGLRKLLANVLMDGDWFIDPEDGIKTFEFQRDSASGPYTMLHFVMRVHRQQPDSTRRPPNTKAKAAVDAYRAVVDRLFKEAPEIVSDELAAGARLNPTLDQIYARRERYLSGQYLRE